jgi:NADH-quinone oxidoreductase subunit G
MSDSGRLLYKDIRSAGRLDSIRVNAAESALEFAVAAAAELISRGGVAVVGSGRSSVEEQFLTRKLAQAAKAEAHLVARVGEGDKILISSDRNPNVRGALVTGLISQLPSGKLSSLAQQVDSGAVRTIICVGEDLASAGLSNEQLAKVSVVYLGTHANATSAAAKVVIPTLTVFEKHGTLINQQFRIQRFAKAVPAATGATDDLVVLSKLVLAAGGPALGSDVGVLWGTISSEIPVLGTMTYANIPDTGLLVDGSAWSSLAFAEGATLHFKPAAKEAAHA